ncbi:MAG: glutamate--tRNA ligase family protein [Bacteriovoracaceae bacterium]
MKKTRIAPTPSGFLHKGNLCNALLTSFWAKSEKSKLILRIDDGDQTRVRNEYIESFFKTFEWLGIKFDEGPSDLKDFQNHYSQTLLFEEAKELINKNHHSFYACECTRSSLKALGNTSHSYPKICRKKGLSLDFKLPIRFKSSDSEDFVVWSRDNQPSYQLLNILHDEKLGITHIIRGQDLKSSSAYQKELAKKLNFERFTKCEIFHHPLIVNNEGEKLSKSVLTHKGSSLMDQGLRKEDLFYDFQEFLNVKKPKGFLDINDLFEYLFEVSIHKSFSAFLPST